MSKRNDISTPEGYFEDLRMRLSEIPAQPARVSPVRRLAPYRLVVEQHSAAYLRKHLLRLEKRRVYAQHNRRMAGLDAQELGVRGDGA